MIIAFSISMVMTVFMLYLMSSIFGPRHAKRRRRGFSTRTWIGACGLWELSIAGVIFMSPGGIATAVGPIVLGLIFVAVWAFSRKHHFLGRKVEL